MQSFALAGGVLAGDPQVWIDQTVASIELSSSLPLALHARLSGDAGIAMEADGSLLRGATLLGDATIQLAAEGDFTRWVMIESLAPIELYVDGDILVVEGISATFTIEVRASGSLRVAKSHQLSGNAPIVVDAGFQPWVATSARLCGAAVMEVAGIDHGALVIQSPPGAAKIELKASGGARLGGKVRVEGSAVIELYARGSLDRFRYVWLEGEASIEVRAFSAKIGIPPIPSYYIPAPNSRTFYATKDRPDMAVPHQRRRP